MLTKKWRVNLILGLGVIAVSTAAIFVRLCQKVAGLNGVDFSLFIAASRLIITAFIILPAWGSLGKEKCDRQAYYYAIAAGISLSFHFAFWISSLAYTSIAVSTTLVTTNPIWVTIISWFWFKEKPRKLTILGIIIALLGGLLIIRGEVKIIGIHSKPMLGNILALIGAFMASLYLICGRQAQQQGISLKSYIVIAYTTAALILLPLPLLFNSSYLGYPSLVYLYLILMAIIPQLIGHTSFNFAVKFISPTLVSLAILFEPVCSSILAWLLFDEIISMSVIYSALILLLGIGIAIISENKKQIISS